MGVSRLYWMTAKSFFEVCFYILECSLCWWARTVIFSLYFSHVKTRKWLLFKQRFVQDGLLTDIRSTVNNAQLVIFNFYFQWRALLIIQRETRMISAYSRNVVYNRLRCNSLFVHEIPSLAEHRLSVVVLRTREACLTSVEVVEGGINATEGRLDERSDWTAGIFEH